MGVALNVKSVAASFRYWVGVLGMHCLDMAQGKYLRAAYGGQVPLEFYQLADSVPLNHAAAQGRIAFTTSIKRGPYVINDYIQRFKKFQLLVLYFTVTTSSLVL